MRLDNYGFGFLGSATDPAGRSLNVSYGANLKISSIADPTGRHVDYTYNGSGELTDVTDVAGGNWHFTYDPGNRKSGKVVSSSIVFDN